VVTLDRRIDRGFDRVGHRRAFGERADRPRRRLSVAAGSESSTNMGADGDILA
jgi:hypothetical protein